MYISNIILYNVWLVPAVEILASCPFDLKLRLNMFVQFGALSL